MPDTTSKSPAAISLAPDGNQQSVAADPTHGGQVAYGAGSIHDVFQGQIADILARTDLDEEQKQAILVGLACPCCGGGGGISISLKLKSTD